MDGKYWAKIFELTSAVDLRSLQSSCLSRSNSSIAVSNSTPGFPFSLSFLMRSPYNELKFTSLNLHLLRNFSLLRPTCVLTNCFSEAVSVVEVDVFVFSLHSLAMTRENWEHTTRSSDGQHRNCFNAFAFLYNNWKRNITLISNYSKMLRNRIESYTFVLMELSTRYFSRCRYECFEDIIISTDKSNVIDCLTVQPKKKREI